MNCMCSDPWCRVNGCRSYRQMMQPTYAAPTKGCVCPPGSEATCKRSDCGRRDYQFGTAASITVSNAPKTNE